ncbi:MAG: hypothetical protein AAF725_12390 [Acidobacteriota bacterium]
MKRLALVFMIATLLALGGQAFADLCTIDAVPAATLLLPHFQVDLDGLGDTATLSDDSGLTTLFSVNNASAAPTIAHVTFWTDWSQASLDFDIFLTGFDVQTVNLQAVFQGFLPRTADEQTDPDDTISPHGNNPVWDGSFAAPPNCANFFPFDNPVIPAQNLDRLINGHTGQPILGGSTCTGADHGDNIARGYITIDNAVRCSIEFPSDPGYFGGADPVASNVNQLWGDYFIIDPENNFAFGDTLVHIEALDTFDSASTPTGYTFYGRYTAPSGLDNREPLGTTWATRYLAGGDFDGGTDLVVWRDSTANQNPNATYACGAPGVIGVGPSWHPLNETEVVAFDEAEDAVELCLGAGSPISPVNPDDPACFPLESQLVPVGEGELDSPWDFGWLFLNLNIPNDQIDDDVDFGSDGNIAQSFVATSMSALGRFQVGFAAIPLSDGCQDVNLTLATVFDIPILDL